MQRSYMNNIKIYYICWFACTFSQPAVLAGGEHGDRARRLRRAATTVAATPRRVHGRQRAVRRVRDLRHRRPPRRRRHGAAERLRGRGVLHAALRRRARPARPPSSRRTQAQPHRNGGRSSSPSMTAWIATSSTHSSAGNAAIAAFALAFLLCHPRTRKQFSKFLITY